MRKNEEKVAASRKERREGGSESEGLTLLIWPHCKGAYLQTKKLEATQVDYIYPEEQLSCTSTSLALIQNNPAPLCSLHKKGGRKKAATDMILICSGWNLQCTVAKAFVRNVTGRILETASARLVSHVVHILNVFLIIHTFSTLFSLLLKSFFSLMNLNGYLV